MPLLLGLAGLVVDVGFMFHTRAQLQAAADAAALAAAFELPAHPTAAEEQAHQYVTANLGEEALAAVDITDGNRRVVVQVSKNQRHLFGSWLGRREQAISARAAVTIGPVKAMRGLRPLAVVWQDFAYGDLVTIKYDSHIPGSVHGNFGAVALGGYGAAVYRHNLEYGYKGQIAIGQRVESEPGNMVGPTESGLHNLVTGCTDVWPDVSPSCSRVINVLVVDALPTGRGEMTVLGFATFFISEVHNGLVRGHFMEWVTEGEIDLAGVSYGSYAKRLVR
jgi:hypothetical protein